MAPYGFGNYVLDLQRYELRRDGVAMALPPKVFDVLAYLVQHHDRVVSKQELFDHLWPEQFVTDDALGRCIRAARQLLGDQPNAPQYIATARGRGYRFIATVQDQNLPQTDGRPDTALPLADPVTSHLVPDVAAVALEGEFKQVTALYGILNDAMALAERLGPEQMHLFMQRVFAAVEQVLNQYAGTLIEFSGDRFLVLFGAPVAQEDHGPRAVLAALAIRRSLMHEPSRLSMGLHTGRVVVGRLGAATSRFYTAVGETTQVAYHLGQQAQASEILISEAVHAMLPEQVHVARHDTDDEIAAPVYQVFGMRMPRPLREVNQARTPFVGRGREIAALDERLALALDGQGQAMGLLGEPGIGKSRLLAEFRRHLQSDHLLWYEGHCLSYGASTPYLPILDLLRQMIGALPEDTAADTTAKVQQVLQTAGIPSDEARPLLLQLLGSAEAPSVGHPQRLQERTFAVLHQLVLHLAQRQPMVLVIENLHWIDATSEAWFVSLVERLPQTTLFLLATYRPGYHSPWLMQSVATQLSLARLPPDDSRAVVESILPSSRVPDERLRAIVAKADGNPLFLESLSAWELVEHEGAPTPISETVQAVLAARIDQLQPAEKQLLQMASAIGTSIEAPLLTAVSQVPPDVLTAHLKALQTAEFLLEVQAFPEPKYTFKHVLIQDVAYQSLVTHTRESFHRRIADVLTAQFPDIVEHQPETLAHHLTRAASYRAAIPYWHQAGQRAQAQSAHREALSHFHHGFDILAQLPETPDHQKLALELRLTAAPSLIAIEGFATLEVGHFYRQTRTLAERRGNARQLGRVLMGLRSYHLMRAELQTALEIDQRILQLGQRIQEPLLISDGHRFLGQTWMHLGNLVTARSHLEQALDIYASLPAETEIPFGLSGLHPRMSTLFWLASVLWCLGYPDAAMRRSDEAMGFADEQAHPFNFASAYGYLGSIHRLRGEWLAARQSYETAVSLSSKYGLNPSIQRASRQSAILASDWQHPEAFQQMRRDLDAYQAIGTFIRLPMYLIDLTIAYQKAGCIQAGLNALDEAFDHIARTQERWCESECYRLRGELKLAQIDHHQSWQSAEADLCQALAVAQRQQAQSWALRAAMSLGHLWVRQGRKAEARHRLAAIYNSFTEGFDTADLRAGKHALDALAS